MALEQPRKYFDVARPGSKAPSATSRPVIAVKSPLTQDPMFHEQSQAALATPSSQHKTVARTELPKLPDAPVATTELDPTALLIQAGNFVPPEASRAVSKRAVVIAMIVMLVVLSAASYLMVVAL